MVGPDRHVERSSTLPSPYTFKGAVDEDLIFAAKTAAIFGHYLGVWRANQLAKVTESMHPTVREVAAERKPVNTAAAIVLLRWPDRQLARDFVEGFKVVGHLEASGVFKPIDRGFVSEEHRRSPRTSFATSCPSRLRKIVRKS